jgi:predicted permease
MPPDAARIEARRGFGNTTRIVESSRAVWISVWLETFAQDLRLAARVIRRTPGLSATIAVSLALGIGANTAIFSVIDALMLRALPVSQPEQLVRIVNPGAPDFGFPVSQFEAFHALTGPFSGLSAVYQSDRSNIVVNGPGGGVEPGPLQVALVSGEYFETFGVRTVIGRALTSDDDAHRRPVAVISERYWKRRFDAAPDALNRALTLNNTTYEITGVAARNFSGDWIGKPVDVWIPLSAASDIVLERADRRPPWLRIVARLRPGVPIGQAQAAAQIAYLDSVRGMADLRPQIRESLLHKQVQLEPAAKGFSPQRQAFARTFAILIAGAGLVLLIACGNVATLLLARSAARSREMGIRIALGAGKLRIARQQLTEVLALASIGGVLGFIAATWTTRALASFLASGLVPFSLDLDPDARVLAFAVALTLSAGALCGLAPLFGGPLIHAISAARSAVQSGGRFRAGKALVIAQVALSSGVLIAAGLFIRTLHNLKSQDLGFSREHLLLVWTSPEQAGQSGRVVATMFDSLPRRIAAIPGVISASASLVGPLEGTYADAAGPASPNLVATGFFETAGMRLLAGRDFNDHDTETSAPAGIVNQAMAHDLFGDDNPLGKHFVFRRTEVEIVGVVSDSKFNTVRDRNRRMFYIPYRQDSAHLFGLCVLVRTALQPSALAARIREEIRSFDRSLPIAKIDSVEDQIDQSLLQERLIATLSSLFGVLAVALACIGLYGVMSYTTARRTGEIGVRIALGATRADIAEVVLRDALMLVFAGLATGVPGTVAAARFLSAHLFGVSPADPITMSVAAPVMIVVALLAGLVPAARACAIRPAAALRHE